jgi:hypothetical protein
MGFVNAGGKNTGGRGDNQNLLPRTQAKKIDGSFFAFCRPQIASIDRSLI